VQNVGQYFIKIDFINFSLQNTVGMIKKGEIGEACRTHEFYENYILCRRTWSKETTL